MDGSPSLFPLESTLAHFTSAGMYADNVPAPRGLGARALARALDHIERHIGDSLTLTDIAAAACVSRFHFARLFRVSTGQSPMEYVLAKRIALAKAQLARGPQKISATAASLGFFDQSHFTRTFRRMTGYSPREFRHLHAPITRHG